MKLRPVGEVVILRLVPKKDSLIKIPETVDITQDTATIFEVVVTGPGYYQGDTFVESPVKPGDKVYLAGYATTKLEHNGEQVHIGNISDILIVVEEG